MAFDVRLIAEDKTGKTYRVVGDLHGNLAFIEIAREDIRACDQRFKLSEEGLMVGINHGRAVLYRDGDHPIINEGD